MNKLKDLLLNVTYTENGALTFRSTLDAVLDFYYHAPAKRGMDNEVVELFKAAYSEQPALALLALFHLRDVRGGKGERRSFRACLRWLAENDPDVFTLIARFVPEYGRWDDLLVMVDLLPVQQIVIEQMRKDCAAERPSLLAKWLPSLKASSMQTRQLAHAWRKVFGMKEAEYRRALSSLRARLRIVEQKMSARAWGEIEYAHVPSRAAMIYRHAFDRHDPERYRAFIAAVRRNEAKINAATLYPYELVCAAEENYDQSIQALWDALPDYTNGKVGLVVADVSGSMESVHLPGSRARPIDVSVALAIYYAQRNKGPWAGMAITFTDRPTVIELPAGLPLNEARRRMMAHVGFNTNFQAIFELILKLAKDKKLAPEQMPAAIWVVSDMEFDMAGPATTNLEAVRAQYEKANYPMPTLIFWNVASRGLQTPATANEQGVVLVSGFSPSAFQAATENRTLTPHEEMSGTLLSPRYAPIAQAIGLTTAAERTIINSNTVGH